jgi:AraC-like DNA-binding protein
LKDLPATVKLLQSRFARAFKSSTGVSLYRRYTDARIRKARKLMVENEFPLAMTAATLDLPIKVNMLLNGQAFVVIGVAHRRSAEFSGCSRVIGQCAQHPH